MRSFHKRVKSRSAAGAASRSSSNFETRRVSARQRVALPALAIALAAGLALAGSSSALVPQPEAFCFAVADSGDNLVFINKDGDGFVDLGPTGTGAMEAIAFNPDVSRCGTAGLPRNIPGCLYAVNGDDFGFLDYDDSWDADGNDSEFVQVSADVGSCTFPGGATLAINDVDGLQFDITRTDASTGTFVLWATVRDGDGSAPDDVLFQIDPNTGLVDTTPTPGFTGGATCVRVSGPGINVDVDDVAIRPSDGIIYVVNNIGGGTDQLVEVDPVTGAGTVVGFFNNTSPPPATISDMEGLSFGADSVLRGTTGGSGTSPNDFWTIDTPDGDTTLIAPFPSLGDYESVACLTDNLITGTVFFDVEENGTFEPANGDEGFTGARVVVYVDNNNDGMVDGGDTQLCENAPSFTLPCPVTDPNGDWLFPVGQGNFVSEVDLTTLPVGATLTTDNIEESDFGVTDFGIEDPENDYGYILPPGSGDLDITKTSDAGGPVVQGQTVRYTLQVTNNTAVTHSGIEVSDILPAGVTYVAQSTVATGPAEFFARDEFSAVSFGNNDGSVNWTAGWVENDPPVADAGPAAGNIQVTGGQLQLNGPVGHSMTRQVDLSGLGPVPALLSFDYDTTGNLEEGFDVIAVEASNGGAFAAVATLDGDAPGGRVIDISAFASANTMVRFRVAVALEGGELGFVDNVEVRAAEHYFETFEPPFQNPQSFQRQNGSLLWTTDWLEIGESDGPTLGDIQVLTDPDVGGGVLRVRDNDNGGEGVQRQADLSAYSTATLSFGWRRTDLDDVNDYVTVEVSDNGGATWMELDRFSWQTGFVDDPAFIPSSYDISAFIAANTRVRFLSSANFGGGDEVYFNDVRIDARAPLPLTKDNVPGGTNPDLVDGVPPGVVEPQDGFLLTPSATLTITFDVTVDNPLSPYQASLLNLAVVTSDQSANPEVARHLDPVVSGTIGDRVWLDTDGDGVQDIGEEGIANVQVTLYDVGLDGMPGGGDDVIVGTAITGTNGEYLFDHLPPGTYWVDVTDTTVPAGLVQAPANTDPPTSPAPTPTYTVSTGDVFLTADFGYTAPQGTGVIGDFVWADMDRDGIQDGNEVGIGGVTLDLVDLATGLVVDTVTTAADGSYLFTAVAPGEYRVEVTDTGAVLSGSSPTLGPQSVGSALSPPVTVGPADVIDSVDFGYVAGSCLPRIDFETDAAGNPLALGQILDNEWSAWGVTVSAVSNTGGGGAGNRAMIFDSSAPTGGDTDLGSPNQTCAGGGPGVGIAGELGQPAENCGNLEKLLIISEDGDSSDPDDDVLGGSITLDFAADVEIENLDFLDIHQANFPRRVDFFDSGGMPIGSLITLANLGSNSFQPIVVNRSGIRRMIVTLAMPGALSAIDFCLGSLRDKAWLDADGDGVFDVGEQGIAGVTVDLIQDTNGDGIWDPDGLDNMFGTADDEPVVATTTTDGAGNFGFDGLEDGSFLVAITDTNGELNPFGGTTSPAEAGQLPVTITGGADVVGINFGYNAAGVLGDTIWNDADGDGVQDLAEAGIGGVLVNLLDGMGIPVLDGMGMPITTTTAPDGTYFFAGLPPGSYLVEVDPSNFAALAPLDGYAQTGDPDEGGTCVTCDDRGGASLALGGSDLTLDFGYQNTSLADISGTVFEDLDADGVQEAGENGFGGVTVALLDSLGNVIATTTTDANGDYVFPDLPDGDYTVTVTDDDKVLYGYLLTSGLDSIPVTVAGTDVMDVDFGYVRDPDISAIGDFVWFDANRNGIQEAGEGGISGVTLDLIDVGPDGVLGTADDGGIVAMTTTNANGNYLFMGLPAGNYVVDVTDTGGELTGLTPTTGTTDPSAVINLSEGEDYRDADFGYATTTDSALGDTIWYDANGNGFEDPGEVGIAGVTVNLIDPGPDLLLGGGDDVAVGTAVTDAQGNYLFLDLGPGSANCTQASLTECKYYVDVDTSTLPAGYNTTPTNGPALRPFGVFVGLDTLTADFGFDGGTTGSIGDTVYLDVDGSGGQGAGEPGIAGVTLDLIDDATGDVLASTVTDANGNYDFVGLPPGDYNVVVTDLDNVLPLLNPLEAPTPPITITAAGEDVDIADFGYVPSGGVGSIGNQIWRDKDADGLFEPLGDDGIGGTSDDEVGFEGVTVQLWLDDGDGVYEPFSGDDNLVRQTVTDADGKYEFLALPEGTYFVTVSDENGVLGGFTKSVGPTPGADNNSQAQPGYRVDVTAADPRDQTADFGYEAPDDLEITGTAFFDINGDGSFDDPTEAGVESVELFLFRDLDGDGELDPGEPRIDRVTVSDGTIDVDGDGMVDPVGFYAFIDLPPGDYIVTADPSASFVDGLTQTTQVEPSVPQGGIQPVTLPPGMSSNDNDFGFTIRATAVLLSGFEARSDAGAVRVRWETASQSGTVGFYLYRLDESAGWLPVNEDLLPAVLTAPQGAVYELVDATAPSRLKRVYSLVEVEAAGGERVYGPFEPELDVRPVIGLEPAGAPRATARKRSARMEERLEAMKAARSAHGAASAFDAKRGRPQRPGGRPAATDLRLKLEVPANGLYLVSAAEIAAGLDLPLGQARQAIRFGGLSLTRGGEPISWTGSGDGIHFFGEESASPYTSSSVYWLDLGAGLKMDAVDAGSVGGGATSFRETAHLEEDVFSVTVVPQSSVEDFYYWSFVMAGNPTSGTASVSFEVADPVAGAPAELALSLQGVTSTPASLDHEALVRLNGVEIGSTSWNGAVPHRVVLSVAADLLAAGVNTLEIEGVLDGGLPYSTFLLDSVDLTYERALSAVEDQLVFMPGVAGAVSVDGFSVPGIGLFDVTVPSAPVRLEGAVSGLGDGWSVGFTSVSETSRYLAVAAPGVGTPTVRVRPRSKLTRDRGGVDYVVIAPAELAVGAQALVDYRSGSGLSGRVFDLEEVQDVFAFGVPSPEAVRDFLRFAHESWSTAPRWAVLAGGGTFDYKDVQGVGGNLIPPLMVPTPYGLFASDTILGDVAGSDGVPEIAVGRIPALTDAELVAYVEKMSLYESSGTPSVLFLSDDGDDAGAFPAASDALAGRLPEGAASTSVSLSEHDVAEARQLLFDAVAAGVRTVNYLGHGGLNRLADEGLLLSADVASLVGPELPVFATLTCSVGRFEVPGFESLAEALVMSADGGSAAVFAPTGQSLNFEAVEMNKVWIDALFSGANGTVGEAMLETLAYDQVGTFPFMRSIFNLTGDPAFAID